MHVLVRLFAGLRDLAGADSVELELPDGGRVADVLLALDWLTAGMPVVMAVNREYASSETRLAPDDELALIPPVSGGAAGSPHARVTSEPLSVDAVLKLVVDARAGAVVSFSGVTRDVPSLEYEAYAEMAERRLGDILRDAIERHGLCAAAVEHRVGTVALSEPSIVIAASAPHRAEAFAGAREIIDRIKREAPIWKREHGEWVAGYAVSAGAADPGAAQDSLSGRPRAAPAPAAGRATPAPR